MGIYSLTLLIIGIFIILFSYSKSQYQGLKRHIVYFFIMVVFLVLFFSIHHYFERTCKIVIAENLQQISDLIGSWGKFAPLMSIFLMILQAIIAPLPAFMITVTNGVLFGPFWGVIISWVGGMGGALLSFALSRWFFNSLFLSKIKDVKLLQYASKISGNYGFRIIFLARLMPYVSFDLISYAAGLSKIKFSSFFIATGIGMLPATVIYTIFGHEMSVLKAYSKISFLVVLSIVIILFLVFLINKKFKKSY